MLRKSGSPRATTNAPGPDPSAPDPFDPNYVPPTKVSPTPEEALLKEEQERAARSDDEIGFTGLPMLEVGSVTAKALLAVWKGVPKVVVSAPPGAGKTSTVATLAGHLSVRANLSVLIIVNSYSQMFEACERVVDICPVAQTFPMLSTGREIPEHLAHLVAGKRASSWSALPDAPKVMLATSAKLLASRTDLSDTVDVVIIDEAWQTTTSTLDRLLTFAPQTVLVGDPGQIPAIFRSDVRRWEIMKEAPHRPGPTTVLASSQEVTSFHFSSTRRCGPETALVLAPLYPFSFDSIRHPMQVIVDGEVLAEIVEGAIKPPDSPYAPELLNVVVNRAIKLQTGKVIEGANLDDEHGVSVAIVVSRVAQVDAVNGLLAQRGAAGIHVDTANRLQGTEYDAVVAVDPLLGESTSSPHAIEVGRLCVALSRHRGHVSWVTSNSVERLEAALASVEGTRVHDEELRQNLRLGIEVRNRLRIANGRGV